MRIEITIRLDTSDLISTSPAAPASEKPPPAPRASIFPTGQLMRLQEVMTYLKATRADIDAFVTSGRLPKPIRRGRGLLFPADAVRQLVMTLRAAE